MSPRKVRRAQIVSPFGVGAIIDLEGESFVAEDASNWPRGLTKSVDPPRGLISALNIADLRTPLDSKTGTLPYFRFPRWLFCHQCRRMKNWGKSDEQASSAPRCAFCRGTPKLVPMRFVAACGNGHLEDVPWDRWAHSASDSRNQKQCGSGPLRFESEAHRGSGLESLSVVCTVCRARRSLEDITQKYALRRIGCKCRGRQPWESSHAMRNCDESLRVLQRGASNVYFPNVVSALDIPPDSDWRELNRPAVVLAADMFFRALIENRDHPLRGQLVELLAGQHSLTVDQVEAALDEVGGQHDAPVGSGSVDELRLDEWMALCSPRRESDPRDRFVARATPFPTPARKGASHPAGESLARLITAVTLVDRLREVRVLKDFTRNTAEEPVKANLAPDPAFLPAVEVYGEGIFLRFDEDAVRAWECLPQVQARAERLTARVQASDLKWLPTPTPRFLLLHTLAHLLLRQTAFDAGYSTSALRERLYVAGPGEVLPMAGVLLYTAAGDTEGTLGGLVRLGQAERLVPLLSAAIVSASWCSFDPVCRSASGQGPRGLSLAACHACALVPETSCEKSNRLLDRDLLVADGYGFFREVVAVEGVAPSGGSW
ncbi:DrmB family protein [Frankia sp. Cj3]|uniref:DrmB family protein n=1 Tax=Frankia sp. Cj3 TaxID=2880976 RepID=UPI001EF6B9E9|nr:DrmB family protein [Frankia sp. Cj3]